MMNKDAGRGTWLFVTLRLETGEELLFFVDTGTNYTCFDKSLEPKLGQRLGTVNGRHFDDVLKAGVYAPPKLYLGSTALTIDGNILTLDLKEPSADADRPIMGILGMDCLSHYCLQLDFETGKLRFLGPDRVHASQLGSAFPLTFRDRLPFVQHVGLLGGQSTDLLMDSGNYLDGDLDSELFRTALQTRTLRVKRDRIDGREPKKAWSPQCVWNGDSYTDLLIGSGINSLGLRFFARHLVTFDFPKQTMYLRRTSAEPLFDECMASAQEFLQALKGKGQVPGWSEDDEGRITLEAHPNSETYEFRREVGPQGYHYSITRASRDSLWKLNKAWRTDQNDHLVEEYTVP